MLLVQTGSRSLSLAPATTREFNATVPSALVAEDVLCVLVSTTASEPVTVTVGAADVTFNHVAQKPEGGQVVLAWTHIPDGIIARRVLDAGFVHVEVDAGGEDDPDPISTVAVFRVTGADGGRFVEASAASTGSLAEDGSLTVPSLDPEYRQDNVVLYASSLLHGPTAQAPRASVSMASPLFSHSAERGEGDSQQFARTFVSARSLASADPVSAAQVSATVEVPQAWAAAFMLRSENIAPSISLPAEWSAEVGRVATVEATVSDADGTPVSYAWSQTDGPERVEISNVYSRAFSFTPTTPGIYRFVLVATDTDGGRTVAQTTVIVPTGKAGPAGVIASEGWLDESGEAIRSVSIFGDANDETFGRTEGLPVGKPLTLALPPIYGGAAVRLAIRGGASNPSPALRRTVTLSQSDGTLIAERSYILSTAMTTFTFETTIAETALITNRSAMTVTIVDEVT